MEGGYTDLDLNQTNSYWEAERNYERSIIVYSQTGNTLSVAQKLKEAFSARSHRRT